MIIFLKVGREEDEARTKALRSLKELEETQNKLKIEIQKYHDSDPEVLAHMKENIEVRQQKLLSSRHKLKSVPQGCSQCSPRPLRTLGR